MIVILRNITVNFFAGMFFVILSGILMHSEVNAMSLLPNLSEGLSLYAPVLSRDGRVIVFTYQVGTKYPSLGVYQVDADKLAPIALPGGFAWISPVISQDGRYIAAVTDCLHNCPSGEEGHQVVLLDLSQPTVNFTFLTKGKKYRGNPMFSPDGKRLIFVTGRILPTDRGDLVTDYGFSMVPISGGSEIKIASTEEGKNRFYAIDRPYFLSKTHIIFSAIPFYPDGPIATKAAALGKTISEPVGISLYFAKKDNEYDLLPENKHHTMGGLTASLKGDIVFTDLSEGEPETTDGAFNYELFMSHMGKVTQLTHIKSFISAPFISGDGSTVVFLEDKGRNGARDIVIYDTASGQLTKTGIRGKILKHLKVEKR
ncbi:TolB-like translocation protein [Varunaivibrio sulfuroxidans]|uniref:WD40 repeat protein n=1 Tax=Varunaivibrio sulfuroxidans TaxID=1773489 RepID=A0A4R3JAP0_9PROT|nr:PD40 domain-containing protein [Varunaivibrio sulfuroxidans]TCS63059.1 WD40 repeat protein [Varunaivibrio sulfuroxidans]WES31869.1 PD40 domain-containing protein [Varunaivibrio sulfuroxidans]